MNLYHLQALDAAVIHDFNRDAAVFPGFERQGLRAPVMRYQCLVYPRFQVFGEF